MQNPLSKLAIDYWYKVFIVAGAFIFLINGAGLIPAYPIKATALLSIGFFFWGVGEWINHPYKEQLMLNSFGMPYGKISGHLRSVRPMGIILDAVGLLLVIWGVVELL